MTTAEIKEMLGSDKRKTLIFLLLSLVPDLTLFINFIVETFDKEKSTIDEEEETLIQYTTKLVNQLDNDQVNEFLAFILKFVEIPEDIEDNLSNGRITKEDTEKTQETPKATHTASNATEDKEDIREAQRDIDDTTEDIPYYDSYKENTGEID